MVKYYKRNGRFEDADGNPMPKPFAGQICAPMVMKPMPEYPSPIDGRPITSRQARKDDLARNGCVEYEPSLSPTKGRIKNRKFAAKHGLQVSEEYL